MDEIKKKVARLEKILEYHLQYDDTDLKDINEQLITSISNIEEKCVLFQQKIKKFRKRLDEENEEEKNLMEEMTYLKEKAKYMEENKPKNLPEHVEVNGRLHNGTLSPNCTEGVSQFKHHYLDEEVKLKMGRTPEISICSSLASIYGNNFTPHINASSSSTPYCRSNIPVILREESSPESHAYSYINDIMEEELKQVPQYLKGRIVLEQMNNLVQDFNEILNFKYNLLKMKKLDLKNKKETELYTDWKKQNNNKGKIFCTENDFGLVRGQKLSKKELNMIQVLRFLKRVKQDTVKKITYYFVIVQ